MKAASFRNRRRVSQRGMERAIELQRGEKRPVTGSTCRSG